MAVELARLKELLQYDPETGVFTWKRRRGAKRATAGCYNRLGYRLIGVDYDLHMAHRLAWLYVHGEWPPSHIDHINGDPSDNRIANLRLATQSQNGANARLRSDNTSGYKGAYWFKPVKRWMSSICKDGKQVHLGYFDTAEQAHAAYMNAAKEMFGEFARAS